MTAARRAASSPVLIALLAAACSSASPDAAASAGTVTSAGTVGSADTAAPPTSLDRTALAASLDDVTVADVEAGIESFLSVPDTVAAGLLATKMGVHGSERWVPYLVDLLRVVGEDEPAVPIMVALQTITGAYSLNDARDAFVRYGGWVADHRPDPGPGYRSFKARLYALYDEAFPPLIESIDDPDLLAEIHYGGVGRGGIPQLESPARLAPTDAGWLEPDEVVMSVAVGDETVAYAERIIGFHELANDTIGGVPVVVSFCPLCRSTVAFDRRVEGRTLRFETSGLLRNSNKVMVDRETNSLWNQLTGEAVAGPLKGTVLSPHPAETLRAGRWLADYAGAPNAFVVAIPGPDEFPDTSYSYEAGAAYRAYNDSSEVGFPILGVPDTFPPKTEMATVLVGGGALALDLGALADAGPQLVDVEADTVLALPLEGGARLYDATGAGLTPADVRDARPGADAVELADGRRLPRLQSSQAFWFAWHGNHPDTAWWPQEGRPR